MRYRPCSVLPTRGSGGRARCSRAQRNTRAGVTRPYTSPLFRLYPVLVFAGSPMVDVGLGWHASGSTSEGSTRPASVLLVDDRPANLVALEATLAPLGIRTVTAVSGPEALRRLLAEEFALVLLDVQMPGMDGFETATLMKRHPRTAHVPIIFVTAIHREASHLFTGYERGAVDYLTKPFDPEHFALEGAGVRRSVQQGAPAARAVRAAARTRVARPRAPDRGAVSRPAGFDAPLCLGAGRRRHARLREPIRGSSTRAPTPERRARWRRCTRRTRRPYAPTCRPRSRAASRSSSSTGCAARATAATAGTPFVSCPNAIPRAW